MIAALAGALLPLTSTVGIFSTVKAVPIVGSIIGELAMPLLSAGATYGIGQAFIKHFESGGTLLDSTHGLSRIRKVPERSVGHTGEAFRQAVSGQSRPKAGSNGA